MKRFRASLLFAPLLFAGSALLPFAPSAHAAADDNPFAFGAAAPTPEPPPLFLNSAEAGVGYLSHDSYFFGRYGGVTGQGPFALFKSTLNGGDDWDKGRRFWNADAAVYGFDTVSIYIRGGQRGAWKASGFFDSFTRSYTESARTPFDGVGTGSLTLPTNWQGAANSAQFSRLIQDLKPLALKVDWKTVGGDLVMNPYDGYEVRLGFSYRNRQGIRGQSLPFGQESLFAVGVFFPQPVDYDTRQASASVAYTGKQLQWSLGYTASLFSSAVDSVQVPNPFSRSLGAPWPAGAFAGYPFAIAQYGLPPDTSSHQVLATGAYSLLPKTRMTLRVSYMIQSQNDPFLPYTSSPQLVARTPLPRTSLDGKVHKTHIAVGLTSREWKDIDIAARYSFDSRQNLTPMDVYSYVANEAQDQVVPLVAGNSRYIRLSLPHSFTFHQAKAEAGYRILPRTRLSLTYTGDFQHRSDQEVARTQEQTIKAKALTTFATGSAWISTSYAARDGSHYDVALPWVLSHLPAYLNAAPQNASIEQPLLRKYNLADRRRTETKGGATYDITPAAAVNISGGFAHDDYLHSLMGLRTSRTIMFDTDVSYVVNKDVSASAFYSFQQIHADQNGYLIFDTTNGNPARAWSGQNKDTIHTAGTKLTWQASPKVKFDSSYTLSDGTNRIRIQSNPVRIDSTSAPLPGARDITHAASLAGEYAFRANTSLRLGYALERHISRDWQYAGLGTAPVSQILGSGIEPPRYTAHVIWATTRYQF